MLQKVDPYKCSQPCNNCPYRTDAPVRHWDKIEFKKLLETENEEFGSTYGCHKNNGTMCIGWLMKQDQAGLPSIMLRLSLSKHNITRQYLDGLSSPSPLYKNAKEMVKANFPELLKKKKL